MGRREEEGDRPRCGCSGGWEEEGRFGGWVGGRGGRRSGSGRRRRGGGGSDAMYDACLCQRMHRKKVAEHRGVRLGASPRPPSRRKRVKFFHIALVDWHEHVSAVEPRRVQNTEIFSRSHLQDKSATVYFSNQAPNK